MDLHRAAALVPVPVHDAKPGASSRLMAYTIVPAGPSDIDVIQQLAAAVWPVAYQDILAPKQLSYMLDLFYSAKALREQMNEKGHRFFLARDPHAEDIGFASFSVNGEGVAHLHKLYVLPQTQGNGAGQGLLVECERAAEEQGATAMQLNVNRHNRAKTFYERQGYQVLFEEDISIGDGFFMNDYRMGKSFTD